MLRHNKDMTHAAGEPFSDLRPGEAPVRGFFHRAASPAADVLVLTHGAGGNSQAALLVALAEAFSVSGISVLRCDLPFRQQRPHGPPSPASAKQDQAGLRRAATLMKQQFGGRVFLGGQSYGGRQASMLVAADPEVAEALLLLSYPLHPPGRPQQLRTAHLPDIRMPTLFVSGTKDPFGTIEELEAARRLVPGKNQLLPIEGAGHGLLTKRNQSSLVGAVVNAFRELRATSLR